METKKIGKHILTYSKYKYKNEPDIKEFINWYDFKWLSLNLKDPVIFVLWWDWTMIKSIHKHYKLWFPFLWVNFWNKWFILNDKKYITSKSQFDIVNYNLMQCIVKTWDWKHTWIFFNEANITSWNGWMLDLDIKLLNNQKLSILWDWVIVSTTLWSTWYNSSLWWPILPHNIDALVLTAKAPWKPKWQAPIILNWDEKIEIKNSRRYNNYQIFLDWNDFFMNQFTNTKIIIKK